MAEHQKNQGRCQDVITLLVPTLLVHPSTTLVTLLWWHTLVIHFLASINFLLWVPQTMVWFITFSNHSLFYTFTAAANLPFITVLVRKQACGIGTTLPSFTIDFVLYFSNCPLNLLLLPNWPNDIIHTFT